MNDLLIEIPPGFDPEGPRLYDTHGSPSFRICLREGEDLLVINLANNLFDYFDREGLRLSLADARTRDALARWVAGRPSMAWMKVRGALVYGGFGGPASMRGVRFFDVGGGYAAGRDVIFLTIPALATLDAHDDTRLPDGSRRVDAIALGIVVRHLAAQVQG